MCNVCMFVPHVLLSLLIHYIKDCHVNVILTSLIYLLKPNG